MTGSQAGVLFCLGRPEGAGLTEVARELEATPSAMTELIDRMAAAGLVERTPDLQDRRAQRLVLTAAGRSARDEALARLTRLNAELTADFSDADIAVVARWLEIVRRRFNQLARSAS